MRKIIRLNRIPVKLDNVRKYKPVLMEESDTSKKVYAYLDDRCVGEYDSITKCATALGMTRLMVRKAIENEVILESGWILKLTNK